MVKEWLRNSHGIGCRGYFFETFHKFYLREIKETEIDDFSVLDKIGTEGSKDLSKETARYGKRQKWCS